MKSNSKTSFRAVESNFIARNLCLLAIPMSRLVRRTYARFHICESAHTMREGHSICVKRSCSSPLGIYILPSKGEGRWGATLYARLIFSDLALSPNVLHNGLEKSSRL